MPIGLRQREVRFDRLGTLNEQGHCRILPQVFLLGKSGRVREGQRWNRKEVFGGQAQHLTAGDQDDQPRAG
jgi:hypothetical protein